MNELTKDLRTASRELSAPANDGVLATPWKLESAPDADEINKFRVSVVTAKEITVGKLNKENNFHVYTGAFIADAANGEKGVRKHITKIPAEILGTWVYRKLPTKIAQFAIVDEASDRIILTFDHILSRKLAPEVTKQNIPYEDKAKAYAEAQEKFALSLIAKCNETLEPYRAEHRKSMVVLARAKGKSHLSVAPR